MCRFGDNIGVARNLGIDGNEIVLAFQLQPIAAEINDGDSIRAGANGLVEKIAQRPAQRVLIEIACAYDIEARGLQGLRDQTRVIGRSVERAGLISGIADHERDAFFRVRDR